MFKFIKNFETEIVSIINPADAVTLVAGFKAIIATWFISYIMYVGYMMMAGKNNTPIPDIMTKFFMFFLISLFAFNIDAWFDTVVKIVNGLSDWAETAGAQVVDGGTLSIHQRLEDGWKILIELQNKLTANVGWTEIFAAIGIHLAMFIVYGSYFILGIYIAVLLMLNAIILKTLLFIFPIAVVTLYFQWTKGVFERWIEMAISNIFTILLISVFFNGIWDYYEKILEALVLGEVVRHGATMIPVVDMVVPVAMAFGLAALAAVAFALIRLATMIAEKLTRVSIDRLPGSAAASTAAGIVRNTAIGGWATGKAYDKAKGATKGSINAVSALSIKAGNAGSSAHALYKSKQDEKQKERLKANKQGGISTNHSNSSGGSGGNNRVAYKPIRMAAVSSPNVSKNRQGGISTNHSNSSGGSGGNNRVAYKPIRMAAVSSPNVSKNRQKSKGYSAKWARISSINKHNRNN